MIVCCRNQSGCREVISKLIPHHMWLIQSEQDIEQSGFAEVWCLSENLHSKTLKLLLESIQRKL